MHAIIVRSLETHSPGVRVDQPPCSRQAGRVDDAIEAYETALQVRPSYLRAVQGIACLVLRSARSDERVGAWLEDIAMRSDDAAWRDWAIASRAKQPQ